MTTTRTREGKPLHFPGNLITDSVGVIIPPPPEALAGIAREVAPHELVFFARGLTRSACRRRMQPRWAALNRARLELARLCLERALAEDREAPAPPRYGPYDHTLAQ